MSSTSTSIRLMGRLRPTGSKTASYASIVSKEKSLNSQSELIHGVEGSTELEDEERRTHTDSSVSTSVSRNVVSSRLRTNLKSIVSSYKFRPCPRNKEIWLVYFMFFLHGMAEFSTTLVLFFALNAYHKLNPPQTVAVYLATRFAVFTTYPVMGFLADTFFGRYKVLLASLHIAWISSAIFAISFAYLDPLLDPHAGERYGYSAVDSSSWPDNRVITLSICYAIMWIGFTGIRVNLIPFGVDQLPDASAGELSSYFHWYYWCINAGYLVASTTIPFLYKRTPLSYAFLVTNFCFSCFIILLVLCHSQLQIIPKSGNPLSIVYRVLHFAATAKRPRYQSAFRIGEPPPSRINLAMRENGGRFSVEQVEDVKTFFRILLVLLSFFGYFAIFSQLQSTYLLEGIRMKLPAGWNASCPEPIIPTREEVNRTVNCEFWEVPPSLWLSIANIFPILIIVPLFDRVIYPCLRGYQPTMLKRISFGKLFLLISIIVAIVVETFRVQSLWQHLRGDDFIIINAIPFHTGSSTTRHVASPLNVALIIPQYLLFCFAEVLSNITAVEFIYAQSPAYMKGILLGLLFGTEGIATGFAAVFIALQDSAHQLGFCSYFGNTNFFWENATSSECIQRSNQSFVYQCHDSPLCSYIVFLIVALLSFAGFIVSSVRYKFRKRDPDPYIHPWFR